VVGIQVLVVEDDVLNQALVRAVLTRSAEPALRDVSVVTTDSLAGARAILAEHQVDVVLLDIYLPDGSGLALARELSRSDGPAPVVVALTGAAAENEAAALAAGCVSVLGKPYRTTELCELVAGALTSAQHGVNG
jgi:CheY-like chemotaxis protein